MQIIWSICDKNFNLVRPALQFSLQKCHIWSRNYEIFDTSSKFWDFCITYKRNGYFFKPGHYIGTFASAKKGMDTFLFEMSMKWMFTFKNFRNVYWHGKTHSALTESFENQLKFVLQCLQGIISHYSVIVGSALLSSENTTQTLTCFPYTRQEPISFGKKFQEQGDWVIQFNKFSFAKMNFKSQQCSETDVARYHVCSFF